MGQLGIDPSTDYDTQKPFLNPFCREHSIKDIIAGCELSIFILENDSVFVVGSNSCGQLGLGADSSLMRCWEPQRIPFFDKNPVKKISLGSSHIMAILKDGTLIGWGENDVGQLNGIPSDDFICSPTVISLFEKGQVKDVILGCYGSTVILLESGELYTLGGNRLILCGTKRSRTVQLEPKKNNRFSYYKTIKRGKKKKFKIYESRPVLIADSVKHFTLGTDYILMVKEDGHLYAVGGNENGQLGIGNTIHHYRPVIIPFFGKKTFHPTLGTNRKFIFSYLFSRKTTVEILEFICSFF
jgi:alpha-tubulin suppressor-like RCC1 family protein